MTSEASVVDWEDILNKFSSYKGTIKAFCEENNISIHQLYYRRKKLKNNKSPIFHAVSFKEKDIAACIDKLDAKAKSYSTSDVKIEIGKAKIYIPSNDREALKDMFKVIIQSC